MRIQIPTMPTTVIKWSELKWRKYDILGRAKSKAAAAVNMSSPAWETYSPIHCYGFYGQRKCLRLYCMLHCFSCAECKAHSKKMNRLNIMMAISFFCNALSFCFRPGFISFSAGLSVVVAASMGIARMFVETNKMLAWIDKQSKKEKA